MVGAGFEILLNNLGVDIIVLIAFRKSRFGDTGHHRNILTNEVSHIGHIIALLQHHITTLNIVGKLVQL